MRINQYIDPTFQPGILWCRSNIEMLYMDAMCGHVMSAVVVQVFEDTTATTTTTAVPVTTALAVTPETTSFTGSSTTPFYGPNLVPW
jgi:hypothetical protein